jgi:hypothetical protein
MNPHFNEAHQSLFHEAKAIKERVQDAFQTLFTRCEEGGSIPQMESLLQRLGNAIYDVEDLEFTVSHSLNKCRGKLVYVVILDLQQFVDALTELADVLEEHIPDCNSNASVEIILSACDRVRTAAANLKFIRTPVKPEAHELFFNDQD